MPRYTQFETIDDLSQFYTSEIVDAIRSDTDLNIDPTRETPPYRWLKSNYSGFVERLRREHNLSPGEFYDATDLPPDLPNNSSSWAWELDHDLTTTVLDEYITELEYDRGRASSTVQSRRSRLKTYAITYREVHNTADLLAPLREKENEPTEIQRVKEVFRRLDSKLGTLASKRKYVSVVKAWYLYLEETGRAVYNPAANILKRMGWDREPHYDHPAFSRENVDTMLSIANTDEQYLLLTLVGWGLRPVEACELHRDQLILDPPEGEGDIPYVEFKAGERKNARRTRNTVEILVGVDAIRDRINTLNQGSNWSGYLFPSPESNENPITTETARRWFRSMGERADIEIGGNSPKPKMGRRTWYRLYRQQQPEIEAGTQAVAHSQGSEDATVSEQNYLDERTRREARATAMRELVQKEFAEIFDQYL